MGVEVFHYSTNTYPNPPPDTTLSADVITLTLFDQNSGERLPVLGCGFRVSLTFPNFPCCVGGVFWLYFRHFVSPALLYVAIGTFLNTSTSELSKIRFDYYSGLMIDD